MEANPKNNTQTFTKLFNATRHRQHDYEFEWENLGFKFVPSMAGNAASVPIQASSEQVSIIADDIIESALKSGADGILVGGISSLTIFVAIKAREHSLRVYEPLFSGRDSQRLVFSSVRDLTDTIDSIVGINSK